MSGLVKSEPGTMAAYNADIQNRKSTFASILPSHLRGREESLCKSAVMAAIKNPKLLACKQSTVANSLLQAAQLGFTDVSGTLGQAYLVPYKDACQLIIGYRGMIELARRSAEIASITVRAAFKGDEFDIAYGDDERFVHKPSMDAEQTPDTFLGAYVIAKFTGGGQHREFMSKAQIDRVMRSSQSKGAYGPWKDHYIEMAKKTVVRRAFKYWPMSLDLQSQLQSMAMKEDDKAVVADIIDGEYTAAEPETQDSPSLSEDEKKEFANLLGNPDK